MLAPLLLICPSREIGKTCAQVAFFLSNTYGLSVCAQCREGKAPMELTTGIKSRTTQSLRALPDPGRGSLSNKTLDILNRY